MTASISNLIQINVDCQYLDAHSRPDKQFHFYGYKIHIVNKNPFPVKLISRCWVIKDSAQQVRVVRGSGVVGQQPILQAEESYSYNSGCDFRGILGQMQGYYIFKNLETQENFQADIPEFICQAIYTLN